MPFWKVTQKILSSILEQLMKCNDLWYTRGLVNASDFKMFKLINLGGVREVETLYWSL